MDDKLDRNFAAIIKILDPGPGAVIHVSILHDPGCPALKTQKIADCTCKPDIKKACFND